MAELRAIFPVTKLALQWIAIYNKSFISTLNVTVRLENSYAKALDALLHISSQVRYSESTDLRAVDSNGDLPLSIKDDNDQGTRQWTLSRDPCGIVVVNFNAQPIGDIQGVWGRSELRYDQDGAIGQGGRFIPFPPGDDKWNVTIRWKLPDDAPEDTRFASSFGDIQDSFEIGSPAKVFDTSVFGVGPLNRWPAWGNDDGIDAETTEEGRKYAMYWIGDLPWDSSSLAAKTKDLYIGMSRYFDDNESDFRVFYRRDNAAFGGVGTYKSFLMEYREGSELESPAESLLNLVSHEIVHSFALTSAGLNYDKWYVEGVAEYLAAVGPFIGGTMDAKTFVRWLNDNAIDYYTASPLHRTWDSLIENYWSQGTLGIKAPYTRGFMYLAYAHSLIAAVKGDQGIDDVILALYKLYVEGKPVDSQVFIAQLATLVGEPTARASFECMSNGTMLIPSSEGFLNYFGLRMVRRDRQKWELGFNESSLGTGVIEGLVAGSRAEKAGLREGDTLTSNWGIWTATDSFANTMRVTVLRDGREEIVEWWPRSYVKVGSWEWLDMLG